MTCTEHKLDRGFISIFCYMDYHYDQRANEPIEQGERCSYKDIPLRQISCHRTGHMDFSSHREMRRGAAKWCPLSEQWNRKRTAKGNNIDTIFIRRNITTTIFTLYGPYQFHFTNYFGKMLLLEALLTHLPATGGDGQTCYTWYRWLRRNQCCQGNRKMETNHKTVEMLQ